jgi:hypothetical protein
MNRIALVALAAGFALTPVPTRAEVRVGIHIGNGQPVYGRDYDRGRYHARRIAFDNGYRDGLREGEKDNSHHDRYNYRDERRYREGDAGYRRDYGSRYEYVNTYRDGFEEGYSQAYSNRRGRGRHFGRR